MFLVNSTLNEDTSSLALVWESVDHIARLTNQPTSGNISNTIFSKKLNVIRENFYGAPYIPF